MQIHPNTAPYYKKKVQHLLVMGSNIKSKKSGTTTYKLYGIHTKLTNKTSRFWVYKFSTSRSRIACWHHVEAGKRIFGIFARALVFVLREKYFVEKKNEIKKLYQINRKRYFFL